MNLSAIFIIRPIATSLLTFAFALAGYLAFVNLPLSALPQVDVPSISVQALLPGASPETMAATVATPLERALGRIAGVTDMTSKSLQGVSGISLQFSLERDIYAAGRDVQAAINAASELLPTSMPSRPSYTRSNPTDVPVMILALTSSESEDRGQMYDFASTVLAKKIRQIPGVADVQIGGGNIPAIRIELNPYALSKYAVGLEDIRNTINQTNLNRPKGILESGGERWQIIANDQATKVEDYLPLILRYHNNAAVRLSDVGQVIESVEDLRNIGIKNSQAAVLLTIKKQSSANAITIVDQVKAMLPELQAVLPTKLTLTTVLDQSIAVRTSINEVEQSLMIAIALVFLVTLFFLCDLRSTLVPMVSMPVSLLSTCLVMYFCHYSLNNLTLMALIVATGFVVDDAIVVVENTKRHISLGFSPFQAALLASKEVGFTVLAMTLSLVAVFLPVLFMSGVPGRIFREFAVTLSASVIMSLILSLTTTPMLCARWLKPDYHQSRSCFRVISVIIKKLQNGYAVVLAWVLDHGPIMLAMLLTIIVLNVYLYLDIKKAYFPAQDTGRLNGIVFVDQSTSFWAIKNKLFQYSQILQQDPAVKEVVGYAGGGMPGHMASLSVVLKPHSEREGYNDVIKRLQKSVAWVAGARIILFNVQDLQISGQSNSASYSFSLQSDDLHLLWDWMPKILAELKKKPVLQNVNVNLQTGGQQIDLEIDRDKASRYGISQSMIEAGLYSAFGQRQVSVIYQALNQYHVIMELAPEYWQTEAALNQIFISVPGASGHQAKQVPLSSFAHFTHGNTPLYVEHQGQFAAVTFGFSLQPGIEVSVAKQIIQNTLYEIGAPTAIKLSFQGMLKAEQDFVSNQPWLILATIITLYILLGMLYESYIHPLTLLSTLPSAGVGALLALKLTGFELNITAMIGILLLVGIVKKNAIMMIDFAVHAQRVDGLDGKSAIYQACLQRFRPIMMTSCAALFGALPLVFTSGYGAELRQPLGVAIVGGMLFSQLLTLFTTPVVYLYLERFQKKAINPLVQ